MFKTIKELASDIYAGWIMVLGPFILLITLFVALFLLQNCDYSSHSNTAEASTVIVTQFSEDKKPKCKEKMKQIKSQRDKMADELDKINSILKDKRQKKIKG